MVISIAQILAQWEVWGVFDLLLPFLLIFAVVFGVLSSTNWVSSNKGVHVIISLLIGLMALRLGFVQTFFTQIFPRLGVGLAVILALVILVGLFIPSDETRYWAWGIAVVGVIIWIVAVFGSFSGFGWYYIWEDYAGLVIGVILLIGIIVAVVAAKGREPPVRKIPLGQALFTPVRANGR